MSTEEMNAYIQRTNMENDRRYELSLSECRHVCEMIMDNKIFEAVTLIFDYGKAKGYRMARRALK